MTYRVIYAPSFREDIRKQVAYMVDETVAVETIESWFGKLYDLVDKLDQFPKRHPVDPIQSDATGCETRKMVFGDYLVFYQVDEDQKRVDLVAFVHGATRREVPDGPH